MKYDICTYVDPPEVLPNFIVFEGIDGSGITTQSKLLADALREKKLSVNASREPTNSIVGQKLRKILDKAAEKDLLHFPCLLASDRSYHLFSRNGIVNDCLEGTYCISDRYVFSSLAYQSMDHLIDYIWDMNSSFPLPEHLFFLDIEPVIANARIEERLGKTKTARQHFENIDTLQKVSTAFHELLIRFENMKTGMTITCIKADLPEKSIHETIMASLNFD